MVGCTLTPTHPQYEHASLLSKLNGQKLLCINKISETLHPHPMNVEQWDKMLQGDVDRDFLLDSLTNGFRLIDNDTKLFPSSKLNYKSATGSDVKEKVEKQIIAKLEAGNYVIANEPPTLISTIGAIPKSDQDEVCLIHDCS